ncbi:MAG: DUF2314 domain-containing protein [Gemmataceae bacterium]|nr:DUF2314 domain-containing protein [Gemmataceae bacterium]
MSWSRPAVWLCLLACGCTNAVHAKKATPSSASRERLLTFMANDDPRMCAAIADAHSHWDVFVFALQNPGTKQKGFSVKAPFREGRNSEQLWLTRIELTGENISGIVDDEPVFLRGIRRKQVVQVTRSQISDWMFLDQGKIRGGYTIRALRDSLGAEERARFLASFPYSFAEEP